MEDGTDDESVRGMKEELTGWEMKANVLVEMSRSQPIGYYLKHEINKKIIEGLVDNHKYNDSLLATRLERKKVWRRFRPWANLPTDILSNIADRLPIIELLCFHDAVIDDRRYKNHLTLGNGKMLGGISLSRKFQL
ncbi:hypothetical protein Tco_1158183 [Tanacetum coccineum]